MMAYVTMEDDTASIEMLAFSNVLSQYGSYIRENAPIVVTGRLSLRDDKEPQIVINRARPISDYAEQPPQPAQEQPKRELTGKLYLKLPSENAPELRKVKAILNMFPGENATVVYFADTKLRRQTHCTIDADLLKELRSILGEENVGVVINPGDVVDKRLLHLLLEEAI